jgi:hypothetical protein
VAAVFAPLAVRKVSRWDSGAIPTECFLFPGKGRILGPLGGIICLSEAFFPGKGASFKVHKKRERKLCKVMIPILEC